MADLGLSGEEDAARFAEIIQSVSPDHLDEFDLRLTEHRKLTGTPTPSLFGVTEKDQELARSFRGEDWSTFPLYRQIQGAILKELRFVLLDLNTEQSTLVAEYNDLKKSVKPKQKPAKRTCHPTIIEGNADQDVTASLVEVAPPATDRCSAGTLARLNRLGIVLKNPGKYIEWTRDAILDHVLMVVYSSLVGVQYAKCGGGSGGRTTGHESPNTGLQDH